MLLRPGNCTGSDLHLHGNTQNAQLMALIKQIAKHLGDVHFGGNWTWSNLHDTLDGVTWQQATAKVHDFNTILALTYHIHYFVGALIPVLEGGELDAHDKFSFDHPSVESKEDWEAFKHKVFSDARHLVGLVEQLPEERLWEVFTQEKYGNYYRNLHGLIEHTHYHLGQIALIKKLVQQ